MAIRDDFEVAAAQVRAAVQRFALGLLVVVCFGAMLSNMDTVLRQATGLPVSVAEDPLLCVALGTGHAVENIDRLRGVLSSMY